MKRADIQGLRCICIIMVLLFHYYPNYFPQGRLGVDMFFVISGFLIAMMLSKKKEGFFDYCIKFYWRRMKRIVPLCYLVFLISFVAMYALQLDTFFPVNRKFGRRTLVFLANLRISEEDEYEAQLTGAKILFTHYWSLSTEIQFYLLAPFIVLSVQAESVRRKMLYFGFLFSVSFIHYITTSEAISFNSPLARLWQFLAGFVAFYNYLDEDRQTGCEVLDKNTLEQLSEQEHEKSLIDDDISSLFPFNTLIVSRFALLTVVIILFIPAPNDTVDTVFRVLVTIATVVILMADGRNPKFLEHPLLVYFGDISFALYLVHWPTLCFVKHFEHVLLDEKFTVPIAFVLSLAISIFFHEFFEKRYLMWSTKVNILLILLLFLTCSALVFVDFDEVVTTKGGNKDDFFEKAIRGNIHCNMYGQQDRMKPKHAKPYQLDGFEDSISKEQKLFLMSGGAGNLTILIIGNSYAPNHAAQIYEGLKQLHKHVVLYWTRACETLLTTTMKGREFCVPSPMRNEELLKVLKPDLLFIVERGLTIKDKCNTSMILEDDRMQEIARNLQAYQQYTKRIFILGPIRKLVDYPPTVAMKYLKKKQRLRDSPTLVINDNVFQKLRVSKIVEVCPKCVVYEWEHIFYNSTGHFVPYDEATDVLYFDYLMHLGVMGMKKIGQFYKDLGKELEWMLEKELLLL